jgi:2'-5' RNA ligase
MSERFAAENQAVKRVFVGSFLSGELREQLGSISRHNEALSSLWQRKLRWVKAAKLHMTWAFLGSLPSERLAELKESLVAACSGSIPMTVAFDLLEIWPSFKSPRQLVLTASTVAPAVTELALTIRAALANRVLHPDNKQFRPHVTLLRFDSPKEGGGRASLCLPGWLVDELALPVVLPIATVDLIESRIDGGGNDYAVLATCRLSLLD